MNFGKFAFVKSISLYLNLKTVQNVGFFLYRNDIDLYVHEFQTFAVGLSLNFVPAGSQDYLFMPAVAEQ